MPVSTYRVAWWRRWIARPLLRFVFGILFLVLARVKITGRRNVPRGKPYIVVFNHVSLYDPPFLGVFWPEALEAMGASDIWKKPGQNILIRMWGAIPVHRGEYDRALFDKVLSALGSGLPLAIAPEGGRSHKPGLRLARPGLAYIVEKSALQVVPVAIVGTTDDFWEQASHGRRPALELRIGRPFRLPALEGKGPELHEARQRNTDQVMNVLAGLLPEEYRGVYAATAIPPRAD